MGLVQHMIDRMQMTYQDDFDEDDEDDALDERPAFLEHFKGITGSRSEGGRSMRIVLVHAVSIEDSKEICDQILMGNAVIINMERASEEQKSRIIDFISGAVYGLNGSILSISQSIYAAASEVVHLFDRSEEMIGK